MQSNIFKVDFSRTVHDYDYTKNAIRRINEVVTSEDFVDMDSDLIFDYLFQDMELVSFKDFLKRYIYEAAEIPGNFKSVPDEDYEMIIMDAFAENRTPHSFQPTTRRWPVIVKSWLTQNNVHRDTVLLLGFGLKMEDTEVEEFLLKVLKEKSFNFRSPVETVFWYCYHNGLAYPKAKALLAESESCSVNSDSDILLCSSIEEASSLLIDDKKLLSYVCMLRTNQFPSLSQEKAKVCLTELVLRAKKCIADIYSSESTGLKEKTKTPEQIRTADIEKIIYNGVPRTKNGNLMKMSASVLGRHFGLYRLSRQRLDQILKDESAVERFDLLTLLFFIYTQEQENANPEDRFRDFLDEANQMLRQCDMYELYPVNPYEAFILMCLVSEYPLPTYSDIWEMSFDAVGDE